MLGSGPRLAHDAVELLHERVEGARDFRDLVLPRGVKAPRQVAVALGDVPQGGQGLAEGPRDAPGHEGRRPQCAAHQGHGHDDEKEPPPLGSGPETSGKGAELPAQAVLDLLQEVDLLRLRAKPVLRGDLEFPRARPLEGDLPHPRDLLHRAPPQLLPGVPLRGVAGQDPEHPAQDLLFRDDRAEPVEHARLELVARERVGQGRPLDAGRFLPPEEADIGRDGPRHLAVGGQVGDVRDDVEESAVQGGVVPDGIARRDAETADAAPHPLQLIHLGERGAKRAGELGAVGRRVEALQEPAQLPDLAVRGGALRRQLGLELLPRAAQEARRHAPLLLGFMDQPAGRDGQPGELLDGDHLTRGPGSVEDAADGEVDQPEERHQQQQQDLVADAKVTQDRHRDLLPCGPSLDPR